MPKWLRIVLRRVRDLASRGNVRFTHKALRELVSLDLGLDVNDCCDLLTTLTAADSGGRLKSAITDEWMYVFRPTVMGAQVYLKLILRGNCVIISFHEEGIANDD